MSLAGNPTSLLRTVTFPVHQVLESASPPPRVQIRLTEYVVPRLRDAAVGGTGAGGLRGERKTGLILET